MGPLLSIITVGTAAEKSRAAIEADLQRREQLLAEIERTASAVTVLAAATIAHQRAVRSLAPRQVVWL